MLDTNVVVSGVLSPHGPPGRIVDLVIAGAVTLIYDDRILSEYLAVLVRPRFGLKAAGVNAFVEFIAFNGEAVAAAPLRTAVSDPDDIAFVEVAVAGGAEALVTGNLRHFDSAGKEFGLRVLTPSQFIADWIASK
ncbi:MAG: putative toxin-antitoxin system toxin component, PIN family [Actinomycetota bacterium]